MSIAVLVAIATAATVSTYTAFATFADFLQGPDNGVDPGCDCIDIEKDSDLDLRDAAEFQATFMG